VAPGRIEMVDRPQPVPEPGQARLRVERVGICGSDLHLYHGTHPYATYPRIQGHEIAARVDAFGVGYAGPLRVGDRVAVEPLLPCGTCYPCRRGRPNACVRLAVLGAHVDGALAEAIALPTGLLHEVGGLDPELTALVEPISIGVQAATRGAIGPDDRVVVFGAGPIGQAVLVAAVDRGARVLVTDRLASRLSLARQLGAEATAEAGREDLAAIVAEWTDGDGPGVVVDAVGAPAVIRAAIDLVASTGRVVIVGLSDQEVSIPVIEFTRKELTILGSRNNAGRFGEAIDLVRRRGDTVKALITHRFPLERAAEAMAFADEHPAEAEKVMIEVD
jgi:L-gulonate 5-dehydrogenase